MHANIIKIDQSYPLDGSAPQNYIVVQLPTGHVIRAEVSDEETKAVLAAASVNGSAASSPQTRDEHRVSTQMIGVEQEYDEPNEEMSVEQTDDPIEAVFSHAVEEAEKINWMRLPPDSLSPMMKKVFSDMGMPRLMTPVEIEFYVQKVVDGMKDAEESGEVVLEDTKPVAKATVQQNSTIVRRIPPIRTVPKDEWGNPQAPVRTGEIDSGEVVGDGDADEDGVGSI